MEHQRYSKTPRVKSNAESTGGMVFGTVVGVCAAIAVVMLTIKLGMVLFG